MTTAVPCGRLISPIHPGEVRQGTGDVAPADAEVGGEDGGGGGVVRHMLARQRADPRREWLARRPAAQRDRLPLDRDPPIGLRREAERLHLARGGGGDGVASHQLMLN